MLFSSFEQIEGEVKCAGRKPVIAVAGSHDERILEALVSAGETGIANAVLIGNRIKTQETLSAMGCKADFRLVDAADDREAAEIAGEMIARGEADIPMKGLIKTSYFMRAILGGERGFVPRGKLVTQATVFEWQGRLMIAGDCAILISPNHEEKLKVIENCVDLAHMLGIACPKVALVTPLELVNPKIHSTVEAEAITAACAKGAIPNCVVDGPLALDNAVSEAAARLKGIESPVAGRADILIMPDLDAGNIFTKSLTFFAGLKTAGSVNGTLKPVVMCSRTDSPADKYHSLLLAILRWQRGRELQDG